MFKKISLLLTTLLVAPAVVFASAQNNLSPKNATASVCKGTDNNCNGLGGNSQPFTIQSIFDIILRVGQILTFFAIGLAVLFMVYGGVLMITDSGDQARVGKGKKILTNAVIGLVVAIIAASIVTFVSQIAGTNVQEITGGGAAR